MDEVPHLTPESRVYSAVPTEPMSVSSSTCSTSLDATIENGIVTVQLHPKQRVRADHENMIYMSDCFRVKTHGMNVRQFQKGYELGLAEFIYEGLSGRGTVAFGGGDKVVQIKLEDYDSRSHMSSGFISMFRNVCKSLHRVRVRWINTATTLWKRHCLVKRKWLDHSKEFVSRTITSMCYRVYHGI